MRYTSLKSFCSHLKKNSSQLTIRVLSFSNFKTLHYIYLGSCTNTQHPPWSTFLVTHSFGKNHRDHSMQHLKSKQRTFLTAISPLENINLHYHIKLKTTPSQTCTSSFLIEKQAKKGLKENSVLISMSVLPFVSHPTLQ